MRTRRTFAALLLAGAGSVAAVAMSGGAYGLLVAPSAAVAAGQATASPPTPEARRPSAPPSRRSALAVFWVSVVLLGYTYAGYPIIVNIVARLKPRATRRLLIRPRVSILVIAHNEGARVAATLDNLLSMAYPRHLLEIVLASDGSTDDTAAWAGVYESVGVRFMEFAERREKPDVLNQIVPSLSGEIVVLADVRQHLDIHAVTRLVEPFADPRVGAVCGAIDTRAAGHAVPVGVGWYWRYEKHIRRCESAVDSTLGATGAVYAIRRALFESIPDDTILDDVLIPVRIARRGFRVLFDARALAFDSRTSTASGELARTVRTIAGHLQLFARERWLLSPTRNRLWFQTISHQGFRLLLPALHATVLITSLTLRADAPIYRWLVVGQFLVYASAMAGMVLPGRRGVLRFLRGLQPVTWEPTRLPTPAPRRTVNLS